MNVKERLKCFVAGFGLTTDDASVFSQTQWHLPGVILAIYRFIFASLYFCYAIVLFMYLGYINSFKALSTWTGYVGAIYSLVAAINLFLDGQFAGSGNTRWSAPDPSWRHKLQWILMNVFINSGIIVAIVYWSIFQSPFATNAFGISYDMICHIFPPAIGVFEITVTPIPLRIQHAVFTIIYMLIYIINTLLFYYLDPNTGAIYSILDYSNPMLSTMTIFGIAVAIVILQVVIWVLYKLREFIAKKTTSNHSSEVFEMTNGLEYNDFNPNIKETTII